MWVETDEWKWMSGGGWEGWVVVVVWQCALAASMVWMAGVDTGWHGWPVAGVFVELASN